MKRTISIFILIAALTAFFACSQSKSAARDQLELMDIPFDDTEYMNSLKRGDTLVARLFVIAGMDPNMQDEHGSTPLIFASIRGNTDLIEALLKKGADPNMTNNAKATPLMIAASMGRKDESSMLVER